jgi:hypothetical protein
MYRIAILIHAQGTFGGFFLREIAEIWSEQGTQINVIRGPSHDADADLVFNHVDLTVVPEDYILCLSRFRASANARVRDISKRLISRQLLDRHTPYSGPVIVKTNLNYSGIPEAVLASRGLHPPVKACRPGAYPIYPSISAVPPAFWNDPELVVERFTPERREGMYCIRTWIFLGDRGLHAQSYSNAPIVKADNVIRRDILSEDDVPGEIRQARADMGFDFGKFDYVVVDGKSILLDVNRTPALGNVPRDKILPRLRHLADGLASLLKQ